MLTTMLLIFVFGYVLIAIESRTHINKTAIALVLAMVLWTLYMFSGSETIINGASSAFHNFISGNPDYATLPLSVQARKYITEFEIINQLGNISEILFYLLGAMTIVEVIDIHQGFSVITDRITTRNKKRLLWLTSIITFFLSSILDNMTSAIVMMILIHKMLPEQQERWIFGSCIIIAANSGGAWTPIGDITTIMLWINENITSTAIMKNVFLPSVISLVVPVWLISYSLKGKLSNTTQPESSVSTNGYSHSFRVMILGVGVFCLLAVPIFKSLTDLPPFAGIMLMLGMFWIYTDTICNYSPSIASKEQFRLPYVFSKLDFSTILFFLGILMAVGSLEAIGLLDHLADVLTEKIHNIYWVSIIIGFLSSVVDNVPLVAAAMGMFPLVASPVAETATNAQYMAHFVQNGDFWNMIAYCAGTGGSLLIIGSAAGIVVMGIEKINFMWYMKNITWKAIIGFLAGVGIYYLMNE